MIQIWEMTYHTATWSYRCPNRYNPKKTSLRHIIIKLSKIQGKGKILTAAREKELIAHRELPEGPSVHLSAENTVVKGGRLFSEIRKQNTEVHYGYFIQHGAESPARTRQEQEIKGVQTRKKQHSLSLPAGEIILCIETPKDPIKYLLELINEFRKIKIKKSVAFLYTNNELSERETKKNDSSYNTSESKILYVKFNRDGESPVHWKLWGLEKGNWGRHKWVDTFLVFLDWGRISTVKIFKLSKVIYRFNAIPVKIPMMFFY